MTDRFLLRSLTSLVLLFGVLADATLAADIRDVSTPPPVSGRRLSDPDSILPADVLARVQLLRDNLDLVRQFMGRPPSPAPLLRVESAQPREVFSQALNLESRANRLAFEQLRIVRASSVPRDETRPVDVFSVVDSALEAVLLVKAELGIDDAVAEERQPEATLPSEVFNAAVAAGTEINNVLQQRTSPSDVFQLVTEAVHNAAALHAAVRRGPSLPLEPDFIPNKMPSDVYARLVECFGLVAQLADKSGVETLNFALVEGEKRVVTPNDVFGLAALLVEELDYLHSQTPGVNPAPRAYYPGLRFPAHVFQRAGLLKEILEDLVASGRPSGAGS